MPDPWVISNAGRMKSSKNNGLAASCAKEAAGTWMRVLPALIRRQKSWSLCVVSPSGVRKSSSEWAKLKTKPISKATAIIYFLTSFINKFIISPKINKTAIKDNYELKDLVKT